MRRALVLLILGAVLAPVASAATPGASGAVEQAPTLTPKEKVEFGKSALEEMTSNISKVERLLEAATKDKQQEAIECLNKKLPPMRALLEASQSSFNNMQSALAGGAAASSGDTDLNADGEFRKIAVALSKSRDFLQEALSCGGSSAGESAKNVATINQLSADLVDGSSVEDGINLIEDPAIPGSPY